MPTDHQLASHTVDHLVTLADQSPVVPLPSDIAWSLGAWSLVGLLWLLIPIAVAVAERRRGASWAETFLWFLVAFLLPVLGLLIWAVYRVMAAKRSTPHRAARPV